MNEDRNEPEEPEGDEPTHLPVPGQKIEPRGYAITLRFHPEIRLDKKRGHQFAASLTDYLSLEKNEFESHKWTFLEPLPGGDALSRFIITVFPNSIKLDLRLPTQGQEWVENRFAHVLERFAEIFKPGFVLESGVTVRGTLRIDGDARTFLAGQVMGVGGSRFDQLRRPIHLLGLKFFLPPFAVKKQDESQDITEWHVTVRVESLMEDPSKLFLEADAGWLEGVQWSDEIVGHLIEHLGTVKGFLETNLISFIQKSPDDDVDEPSTEE